MEKGLLLIISGPSGSGKGTVCKELLARNPQIKLSVSATTRNPREGEVDGVHYYFRTVEEFNRMIDEDEFLEHANVFGNLYGTPKKGVESFLNAGNDCILEIDVQGGIQVMENAQEYISIFLTPPSTEELERRLRGRGTEEEAVILRRLAGAKEELPKIAYYDYWVVNDTVEGAVKEIESIISAEKNKVDNKINIFKEKFGGNLL